MILLCFSGIKFIVLADPRQTGIDGLLRKIYEIYSDFALKNPFYSLEMPIRYVMCLWALYIYIYLCAWNITKIIFYRCELFDQNLKSALEIAEKAGTFGPGSWSTHAYSSTCSQPCTENWQKWCWHKDFSKKSFFSNLYNPKFEVWHNAWHTICI